MKHCSTCKRTYDEDSLRLCLEDGSILSASSDPQATQRLPGRHREGPKLIDPSKTPRNSPETIHSPAPATMTSPPSAPSPQAEGRTDERFSRRWLLISVPIFVVLLIPVLVGGIWLLTTIVKGGRSERRWLAMLAGGHARATAVRKETTAQLA